MFIAIYSNEAGIGLGVNDKVIVISEACDIDEANEIADNYAEENGIKYVSLDVFDTDDCECI